MCVCVCVYGGLSASRGSGTSGHRGLLVHGAEPGASADVRGSVVIASEDQAALAGEWVKWLGNQGNVWVRGTPEELLTGGTRRVPASCWRDHRPGSAGTCLYVLCVYGKQLGRATNQGWLL